MRTDTTVNGLAGELAAAFEEAVRQNGSKYVRLHDGRPQWMQDAVREAHNGLMPDDQKYRMIQEVADAMAGIDPDDDPDPDGSLNEQLDGLVDVYNTDLADWLASAPNHRGDYVNRALGEFDAKTYDKALAIGQYLEYEEIADLLAAFLRKQADT